MKKKIIPRQDHEVYFFPVPEDLKSKQIRTYAIEQLEKLHPAFSLDLIFDLQRLVFDKKHWIMATVMNSETLAEYKILYEKTAFCTNTSILVHKKEFTKNGLTVVDDEQIGFDKEKNEPISIPVEAEKKDDTYALETELKTVQPWQEVFAKKKSRQYVAAMSTGILGMILISSILIIGAKDPGEIRPLETDMSIEPWTEVKYFPPAIEILARISADIFRAGGNMLRWRYDEDAEPFIEIQMRGLDALTIYQICGQYEYLSLQDIRDVWYDEGEPCITIYLGAERTGHTVINGGKFSAQSSILPMIVDLSSCLKQQKITIASETLPTNDSGEPFYTIAYTAKDWNLVRSLEIISTACDEFQLRVKKMDITIGNGNSILIVICALSWVDISNNIFTNFEDELDKIPLAFGYKEDVSYIATQSIMTAEIIPEPPVIGSIMDGTGQIIFYRDTGTGKIRIRGTND